MQNNSVKIKGAIFQTFRLYEFATRGFFALVFTV